MLALMAGMVDVREHLYAHKNFETQLGQRGGQTGGQATVDRLEKGGPEAVS